MEHCLARLLAWRAPFCKIRPQPSSLQSHVPQRRAFVSDGRAFSFRDRRIWTRVSGSPSLQRAYHSSPEAAYRGYAGANRVVWTIIGLNTAVFGAWQVADYTKNHKLSAILQKHAILSQGNLDAGRYHTFVTSAFSHKDPFHFIFNMMTLSAFGGIAARFGIGGVNMAMLALGSAIASSYAMHYQRSAKDPLKQTSRGVWQRVLNSNRTVERWQALGASGMVMGMGATATLLAPLTPMAILIVPAPLYVVMAGYVALDTYFLSSKTSRVGHAAHLGGLTFGAVFYFLTLTQYGGVWTWVRRGLRR